MSSPGAISVVIRVRNEGPALHRVLCALKVQDVPPIGNHRGGQRFDGRKQSSRHSTMGR